MNQRDYWIVMGAVITIWIGCSIAVYIALGRG